EDLDQDVGAFRAQRAAHADFPDAFADRGEHDVHDADAADDEADRGDAAEGIHVAAARFLEALQQVLARLEPDVLDAAVRVREDILHLLERVRHVLDVTELHVEHVDVLVDPIQRLRRGERNEHRVIFLPDAPAADAVRAAAEAVILQHADDGERLPVDRDDAADRIQAARDQEFRDRGAEDDDLRLPLDVQLADQPPLRDLEAIHHERRRKHAAHDLAGGAALEIKPRAAGNQHLGGDALRGRHGFEERVDVVERAARREWGDFALDVRRRLRVDGDALDPARL